MASLHLEVSNSEKDGKSRRITTLREDAQPQIIEVFYEFDQIIPFTKQTLLDGHVLAILLYASSRGMPLFVHGPVSQSAMRNMHELLLVWNNWKPSLYKVIDIIPDRILDSRIGSGGPSRAISAFSGGVDASFTALLHTKILPNHTRYPLTDVLMVHGFDVEVHNKSDFSQLILRVRPLIDDLNLQLRVVRTNSRDLRIQDWEDSHALELAGCLHMMSDEFQYGLIGSTESYSSLVIPWGSSPVTDHLMSGDQFTIVHDGAGYSRTAKVAEISKYPLACSTLKVCHAGADQSGNCGRCEKCIRTQLNFRAAGLSKSPPCFPRELDLESIRTIKVANKTQLTELIGIVNYAESHQMKGQWLDTLKQRLTEIQPTDAVALARKKSGSATKQFLAKIVTRIGLEEPAKKIWRDGRRKILKRMERSRLLK